MQAVDELPAQSLTDFLQEENFPGNLNFASSLMANSLNLNSAHNYIFGNLSMIAYIIEMQKSEFPNIELRGFDQSEPGR